MNFSDMFRKAMIKPENDRKAERCHVTYIYFCFCSHRVVHFNKIRRLSVSDGGW